jgi:periplasmic protein TonB
LPREKNYAGRATAPLATALVGVMVLSRLADRPPLSLTALVSALLHAAAGVLVMGAAFQRPEGVTERAIEVTLESSTPAFEIPSAAASAVQQAALKSSPGAQADEQSALTPGQQEAAFAPVPAPSDPDIALVLPSHSAPPTIRIAVGTAAPSSAPDRPAEQMLVPMDAPPPVSGRDFARTAPPAQAQSPERHRAEAPGPRQPVRQDAVAKRASQQQVAKGPDSPAGKAPGGVAKVAADPSNWQAQQDYLWLVIRKLSQQRIQEPSRGQTVEGVLIARLAIARDGRLLDVSLANSSGVPGLDGRVVATIRAASPFAPFPADIAVDAHTFTVPIRYARER